MIVKVIFGASALLCLCHFTIISNRGHSDYDWDIQIMTSLAFLFLLGVFGTVVSRYMFGCGLCVLVSCRSQRYHLVDIVDEVLANTDFSTTAGHRSGIAVDDSVLFENTTLPAINMDLSSDPDIVNICKKSYSLEDLTSTVDETDSDSSDTVSDKILSQMFRTFTVLMVTCTLLL